MTTIGERLKILRALSGKTQEEVSVLLNKQGVKADRGAVARWETGALEPRLSTAVAFAKIYNVSLDHIVDGKDTVKPVTRAIPLLGTIAAGSPIYAEQNIESYLSVPEPWAVDYALRVRGESMINAGIPDGSIVLCRRQDDVIDGQIAVCIVDGDEATLKRVKRYDSILVLHPENNAMTDMVFKGKDQSLVKIIGLAKKVVKDV